MRICTLLLPGLTLLVSAGCTTMPPARERFGGEAIPSLLPPAGGATDEEIATNLHGYFGAFLCLLPQGH